MRRPKAKFAVGDTVTDLFEVGEIESMESQKNGKYPGWWYRVQTEEDGDYWTWMHEPDMVKIEPDEEIIKEWVNKIKDCED